MPLLQLKDAADYVRTNKASQLLLKVLRSVAHVFNFTEERHNRVNRYVAVINAYKRGDPITKIEQDFGCTKRTIYDYIKKAGVQPRSFVAAEIREDILRDYRAKIPVKKIAELHGVSLRSVRKIVKQAGLRRYPLRK